MANEQVDEIKQRTDIVQLVSEYVPLKKAGRNFKGNCPFHGEKTPSFMVNSELQIFKCFGCFPAGQKVKTPFGLHAIESLDEDHWVESDSGLPRKILMNHSRDYNGDLVKLSLAKLNEQVFLTGDHMVLTLGGAEYTRQFKNLSRRLKSYRSRGGEYYRKKLNEYFPIIKRPARELRKSDTLLYPISTTIQDMDKLNLDEYITKVWPKHGTKPIKIPTVVSVDNSLLRLLGLYIAEGSNSRAYIRFSLSNDEISLAKEIIKLSENIFGITGAMYCRKKLGKTGLEVSCCNSILANIFENLCGKGSENKHVPFVFQWLPLEKQMVLIQAIYDGDGTEANFQESSSSYKSITTVSEILAEQIRDMLLRIGYFPTVFHAKERIDKKSIHHRESWAIQWSEVTKYDLVYETFDRKKYWLLPIRQVLRSRYEGKVYNLTVADDHTYVANTFAVANCGEGGDVITFLQKIEGMEFGEALENLAKRVGIILTAYKPSEVEQVRERLVKLLDGATEAYHYVLNKHGAGKVALEYLQGRGITKEAIEKFKLGYAPEGWNFICDYLVKKKGFGEKEVESAGMIISGNRGMYDRFRNRVMFPLANNRGQVVGFAGRVLPGADEKAGGKYVNSPETEIYHKGEMLYGYDLNRSEIKRLKTAVVVEGEIDAIASWQAGVGNVVAIKGSALTERQVELLARVCETVVMALDADLAGDAASRKGIQQAEQKGIVVKVARWEAGKDPGDLAISDPKGWNKAVTEAIPVYDFYLESAVDRHGLEVGGKQKIGQELLPTWQAIPDEIVKAHYICRLADILGVREEDVRAQMAKSQNTNHKSQINSATNSTNQKKESEREKREGWVVQLAILGKKIDSLTEKKIRNLFKDNFWLRVVEQLQIVGIDELPAEIKVRVTDLLLTDEEFSEKKWEEAIKLLELLNIEEELDTSEDLERVRELGQRKAVLKKEL